MKYLILTSDMAASQFLAARKTLTAFGTPFDVISFDEVGSADLELTAADGSGLYAGIISTQDSFGASEAQMEQLNTYQLMFGVKWVVMYMYPNWLLGTAALGGDSADATISFAAAAEPYTSGFVPGMNVPLTGSY